MSIFSHADHVEQPLQMVDKPDGEPQHPVHTAATASPEWVAARDQFNGHLAACKACYAPKNRYCITGPELRQRYNSTVMELTQ